MQPTIEITPDTIGELLPQIAGKPCVVKSFRGEGADQAYTLRIDGRHYCITRNTVRTLLTARLLPSSIAIPIIDYAIENDVFKAKRTDDDGEMVFWL